LSVFNAGFEIYSFSSISQGIKLIVEHPFHFQMFGVLDADQDGIFTPLDLDKIGSDNQVDR
jgi:hypothetical protein